MSEMSRAQFLYEAVRRLESDQVLDVLQMAVVVYPGVAKMVLERLAGNENDWR
jgi:hypothetical protein